MKSHRLILLLLLTMQSLAAAEPGEGGLPPLSDSGQWHPGKFIWGDLVTNDLEAAKTFYHGLLGWDFRSLERNGRHYLIAFNQDHPVGGMLQAPSRGETDGRPRWIGYISVDDVNRSIQSVVSGGGRVLLAPKQLPARGEQAVFSDPEGAVFGVMKSSGGDPEDYLAEPGDWIWIQLLSRDNARAGDFYRGIAGYEVIEQPAGRLPDTLLLVADGYARATVMQIPAERPSLKPAWLPFLRVANLGNAVTNVTALGGRLLLAPRPDLLEGRLAVAADPGGAAIGLIEWRQTAGKEGQ